jgi:heme/copper-type cytochrome/quinol oxidase subunit 4
MVLAVMALSLVFKRKTIEQDGPTPSIAADAASTPQQETINNSKYENDLDSVFKFSRALCLAVAAVMLYVYVDKKLPDNLYITICYWIIMAQMATFLAYMAFRHFQDEDLSNVNLFQVAFITATLFVGATYVATKAEVGVDIEYLYYCKDVEVSFRNKPTTERIDCSSPNRIDAISEVLANYRPDFRQLTFIFLALCWAVYEIFWLMTLYKIAFRKPAPTTAGSSHTA